MIWLVQTYIHIYMYICWSRHGMWFMVIPALLRIQLTSLDHFCDMACGNDTQMDPPRSSKILRVQSQDVASSHKKKCAEKATVFLQKQKEMLHKSQLLALLWHIRFDHISSHQSVIAGKGPSNKSTASDFCPAVLKSDLTVGDCKIFLHVNASSAMEKTSWVPESGNPKPHGLKMVRNFMWNLTCPINCIHGSQNFNWLFRPFFLL